MIAIRSDRDTVLHKDVIQAIERLNKKNLNQVRHHHQMDCMVKGSMFKVRPENRQVCPSRLLSAFQTSLKEGMKKRSTGLLMLHELMV